MSSIGKLLISGIRSFGPDENDHGIVKFTSPLTLILGQNGCGKTTIIESLKFAACGELPANCKGGSGFVHDPKLSKLIETRGQVKLQMTDIKGEKVVVTRTVQSTQKAKKMEFKTLDQTITRTDPITGEERSISSRCAEVDNEMCLALGVSKPILNYVIFCHQEDSNWPLDEGKKVKERFDSIFDAVKYNKCLEHIRKVKKEIGEKVKIMQLDLNYLRQYKDEAGDKRASFTEIETRMAASNDRIRGYVSQIQPIQGHLEELGEKQKSIYAVQTKKERMKAQLEAIRGSIDEYRNGIKVPFEGTTEQLRDAISNFTAQLGEKVASLDGLNNEMRETEQQELQERKEMNAEQIKVGQMMQDQEHNKERIEQRNRAIGQLAVAIPAVAGKQFNTETEFGLRQAFSYLEKGVKDAVTDLETLRQDHEKQEAGEQKKIDSLREEKAKLKQAIEAKQKQLNENKAETRKVRQGIQEADESAEKLSRLEARLDREKHELAEVEQSINVAELEQEIREAQVKRDRLDDALVVLERELSIHHQNSKIQVELDSKKEIKADREASIRKIKNKHEDAFKHLFGEIPEHGIKHHLQCTLDKLSEDIRRRESEVGRREQGLVRLDANRKHQLDKFQTGTKAVAADEEEIYQACNTQNLITELEELNKKIQQLQDDKGTMSASEYMYRRYVAKLEQKEPCCPLCHREFTEQEEVYNLVQELNQKTRELPSKQRTVVEQLNVAQDLYKRLLILKPKYEKIATLKSEELPAMQKELERIESNIATEKAAITSLRNELIGPESDQGIGKGVQGDVVLLDQHQSELRKLDREINLLQAKLPSGGTGRSMQQCQSEREQTQSDLVSIRRNIEGLQTRRNNHTQRLHLMQSSVNNMVAEQLKLQGAMAQRRALEDRQAELQAAEIVLSEEIDGAQEQLAPVSTQLETVTRAMEVARHEHRRQLEQSRTKVTSYEREFGEMRKLQNGVEEYTRRGGDDRLAAAQAAKGQVQRRIEATRAKKARFQESVDSLRQQLASQRVRERELHDNLKMRDKEVEEKELVEKIETLTTQIGNLDPKSIVEQIRNLQREIEIIYTEKAHAEGRQRELEKSLQSLRAELNKDQYKNADKNYRDKSIAIKVQELAADDLNEYFKAMDWAMMHFHGERMKSINSTIRELWRTIYRGNDIDYIEIQTDADANLSADKRRTYNYRVVQVKNGTELDMRGRCSAGQKVLACLIIRMALAETFSYNCGILALDEPTTNLDRDNIESLSSALADIVKDRGMQKNFQLVVITHDEEFLDRLTKVERLPFYFKVLRDRRGKSKVLRTKLDG